MGDAAKAAGPEAGLVQWWVEKAATGIELLAVTIIVATIALATLVYLGRIARGLADVTTYRGYRHQVARALLLGLELLVAADIIRTVALAPTLRNVLILGLLVIIRTVLSWGLVVEIEERWPWQARPGAGRPEGQKAVI
jgi:uncharacterized membrane protein